MVEPREEHWQKKIPSKQKRETKNRLEVEKNSKQKVIAFRDDEELKNYLINEINKKAPTLLNYASIEIKKGIISVIGNVRTLYEKNLFLSTIKELAPLKIRDQLKIKPLNDLSETRLANKIAEVIGKERIGIKGLIGYSFRVKGNTVYFKAQLNKNDKEIENKICETLSKIEGIKNIVISFSVDSLNTSQEENIEEEIKKIILNREGLNLNKIKIFAIDSTVFLNGEVESYSDMLYLEEKVSEIEGLREIFNQLIVAF